MTAKHDEIIKQAKQLHLSTIRLWDVARNLAARVAAVNNEARELLKELEADDEQGTPQIHSPKTRRKRGRKTAQRKSQSVRGGIRVNGNGYKF